MKALLVATVFAACALTLVDAAPLPSIGGAGYGAADIRSMEGPADTAKFGCGD